MFCCRAKSETFSPLHRLFAVALVLLLVLIGLAPVQAHERSINSDTWFGIANEGFDPVSYFVDGEAHAGRETYRFEWGGVTWQFRSAHNKELFAQSPNAYIPSYGGYGAYGMAQGYRTNINPFAYLLTDGRLYLFASEESKSTWTQNMIGHRHLADQNWLSVAKGEN